MLRATTLLLVCACLMAPGAASAGAPKGEDEAEDVARPRKIERRLTTRERWQGKPYLQSREERNRDWLRQALHPTRADYSRAVPAEAGIGPIQQFPGAP